MREAVRLKKEAFRVLLTRRTPETVAGYRQARRAAAAAVTEAKRKVWERFGEDMERDFWTAPKCFWKHFGGGGNREASKLFTAKMGHC